MTEDELVARIRERANDPIRRTAMCRGRQKRPPLPQPAPFALVRDAEREIGFPFPNLLVRLWIEVANGGFGPGYGLFGLEGGYADDVSKMALPEIYLDSRESRCYVEVYGEPWPEKLIEICHWGGGMRSAIDCSAAEAEVLDIPEDLDRRRRSGQTFAQWMEAWVNGVNLFRGRF